MDIITCCEANDTFMYEKSNLENINCSPFSFFFFKKALAHYVDSGDS